MPRQNLQFRNKRQRPRKGQKSNGYDGPPSFREERGNEMPPRRCYRRDPRARLLREAEQKTNDNNNYLIKRSDWEPILANIINEDGGVYTSDEDDIERQYKQKVRNNLYQLGDRMGILVESEAEFVSLSQTNTHDLPLRKTNSDKGVAKLTNMTILRSDTKKSLRSEDATHLYFGIKEVSDLEFTCGSHIFHVHSQLIEHFVSNMADLLSGKIVDWIGMNKICQILYNHRIVDEQFLACTECTDKSHLFWKDGNSIMHLARRLGIAVVQNYMDRAVAFYRCDNFRKCSFCSQRRRLFATVYNLDETKVAHLQLPEPGYDFKEMLYV